MLNILSMLKFTGSHLAFYEWKVSFYLISPIIFFTSDHTDFTKHDGVCFGETDEDWNDKLLISIMSWKTSNKSKLFNIFRYFLSKNKIIGWEVSIRLLNVNISSSSFRFSFPLCLLNVGTSRARSPILIWNQSTLITKTWNKNLIWKCWILY